jgi:8-oxo-dGTP diphosphatase
MAERRLRVAAYGVCVEGDRMLIVRYVSQEGSVRHWTLPGGGVEHGEDPQDTMIRELAEERAVVVDVGLELNKATPADGHTPSVEVAGLLRY